MLHICSYHKGQPLILLLCVVVAVQRDSGRSQTLLLWRVFEVCADSSKMTCCVPVGYVGRAFACTRACVCTPTAYNPTHFGAARACSLFRFALLTL